MIDFKTKIEDLPVFVPNEWKPINYYPYTTLINGIWKERYEWRIKNESVYYLWKHSANIIINSGYIRNNIVSKELDNKVAIEIVNTLTNEILFIGFKDSKICIGSKISFIDSWLTPCKVVQ